MFSFTTCHFDLPSELRTARDPIQLSNPMRTKDLDGDPIRATQNQDATKTPRQSQSKTNFITRQVPKLRLQIV